MRKMLPKIILIFLISISTTFALEVVYDDYISEINEAFKIEDYEAALYLSNAALSKYDKIELFKFKAEALLKQEKYTDSFKEWSNIIGKAPKDKDGYYYAMYCLREIIKTEKSGYKKTKNKELIYKYYEKFLELDGYNDSEKIYDLGNMYLKDNLYEKSYKIFSKDKNDYYKNLFGAALTGRFLGDYKTSISLYQKLLETHPEIEEAYFGLAISYRLSGDFDNSIRYFQKHLEYQKLEKTYIAIAEMDIVMEKYASAKTILELGKESFPKSQEIEELLIEVYSKLKG